MSHEHDLLSRALADRAERLDVSGPTMGDVVGRAHSIRRRRRIATGVAAAAAVAILVPGGLWAGSQLATSGQNAPDPAETPSQVPDPTPSEAAPAPTVGGPLLLDDIPTGEAPARAWIHDGTLHAPDGSTVELGDQYGAAAPYDDGWLLTDNTPHEKGAVIVDADGTPVGEPFNTGLTTATTSDGRLTAYLRDDELRVHDNSTGDDTTLRDGMHIDTGIDGVAEVEGEPVVYYTVAGDTESRLVDGGGDRAIPTSVSAVSGEGWVSVVTEVSDDGSCSTVFAPHGNEVVDTCDWTLQGVAPDGGHVIGAPAYLDGFGDGELGLLALDAGPEPEPVVAFEQDFQNNPGAPTLMGPAVWEDAEHALVVTAAPTGGNRLDWAVVRVGLDGTVEYAVEPLRAGEFDGIVLAR